MDVDHVVPDGLGRAESSVPMHRDPQADEGASRLGAALFSLAVPVAAAVLAAVNPVSFPWWLQCPFHALTGYHCPGCGTLRGLHALAHGHVLDAFGMNPLTMLMLPVLGYLYLSQVVFAAAGRRWPAIHVGPRLSWTLVAVVIVFWVLRNVPVEPFSWLAP